MCFNLIWAILIFYLVWPIVIEANSESKPVITQEISKIEPRMSFIWQGLRKLKDYLTDIRIEAIQTQPYEWATNLINKFCSSMLKSDYHPNITPPQKDEIRFKLYTAKKKYSVLATKAKKLWRSKLFDRNKRVFIYATGFITNVNNSDALDALHAAFLKRDDFNFVIVDHSNYLTTLYNWAVLNTKEIGKYVARGLVQLAEFVPLESIYLAGHSMGAHIMATAARIFTKLTGKLIPRITGLDPAKPCFRENNQFEHLQRGDAEFVDIIHGNIGVLGIREPIGDIDFYPGGTSSLPPGCITMFCAHSRAWQYFVESVYPENEYNFLAYKCDTWKKFEKFKCSSVSTTTMGFVIGNKNERGIMYVAVKKEAPFGRW